MPSSVGAEPSEPPGGLRRAAASGAKWTGGAAVIVVAAQFVRITAVAHLLKPSEIGLSAIVVVVVGFANAFADFGLSNAIIARQTNERPQLSSLYWANLIAGSLVFASVFAATPLIVDFYGEPRLAGLLRLGSLAFLIAPIGQQFQALLEKELKFARLAKIEAGAAILGTSVAVATAASGAGASSLIWGQLALTGARAGALAALHASGYLERLGFDYRPAVPRLVFRRPLAMGSSREPGASGAAPRGAGDVPGHARTSRRRGYHFQQEPVSSRSRRRRSSPRKSRSR